MVRASVLRAVGSEPQLAEIDLRPPGPGQVRVRIAATGVCHSDLSLADGTLLQPVPAVLGHESAGTVAELGPGVTGWSVGDRVLLCWAPPCGACWFCAEGEPWLCERSADASRSPYASIDNEDVYPGLATGGFAEETVVGERALVRVPEQVPLDQAALVGCAVMTGVGAVLNTAKVRAGQSVLVLGLGGVGLSAVQGARLAGASQVLVVDPSEERRELALKLGATEALPPGEGLGKEVRARTGGRGADHAFDCVGRAETIRTGWSCTRRGGSATIVGIGGKDQQVTFNALELFHFARSLTGCVYGSTDPQRDLPRLLEYAADGRLDLAALVTSTVGLDGVAEAFGRARSATGARTLVVP